MILLSSLIFLMPYHYKFYVENANALVYCLIRWNNLLF